jgi:predicted nucleotidyltransferase component of viral defense system
VLGFTSQSFSVENGWFSGSAEITTYHIDELLGTKMRALYQRRKGRDLFDLWMSAQRIEIDPTRMIECFRRYIAHDGLSVSRAEFEKNLTNKLSNPEFAADLKTLLAVGVEWRCEEAGTYILEELAPLLPGKSWRGEV